MGTIFYYNHLLAKDNDAKLYQKVSCKIKIHITVIVVIIFTTLRIGNLSFKYLSNIQKCFCSKNNIFVVTISLWQSIKNFDAARYEIPSKIHFLFKCK